MAACAQQFSDNATRRLTHQQEDINERVVAQFWDTVGNYEFEGHRGEHQSENDAQPVCDLLHRDGKRAQAQDDEANHHSDDVGPVREG